MERRFIVSKRSRMSTRVSSKEHVGQIELAMQAGVMERREAVLETFGFDLGAAVEEQFGHDRIA